MLIRRMYIGSIALFLTLAVCCIPASYSNPLPSFPDEFNGLFFRNTEVFIDKDGSGTVSTGDIFWGVLTCNEIVAPTKEQGQTGPKIWPLIGVPPAEITGYFATEVVEIYPVGHLSNPFPVDVLVMGPAEDPNSILVHGEVLRVYEDTNLNFDDSTQRSALLTGADGALLWSFGLAPGAGSIGGYWYALAPQVIPDAGNVGEAYAGLNVIIAPPGDIFGLVNDPNEDFSTAPILGGLDVQFWFNSELFRLPVNADLEIGPDKPMHFGSNDPAVYRPESAICTGSIGDFVWHDLNKDGILDAGEPGIDGVTVNLKDDTGTLSATTTSGPNGFYQFTGLCAGDYTVEVDETTLPSGFVPTTSNAPSSAPENDSNGSPADVTLPADDSSDQTIDFGYITAPCTLEVEKKCVVPPEPGDFVCSDAKPIDTLTMIWSGTEELIKVLAHKGKKVNDPVVGTVDNIMVGDEVTISGFGGKTDVMWEIFQAGTDNKIGESTFHLSCSDQDMNDPEDCGKPQGDGKDKSGFINDWEFAGMAGDLTLDCDPTPPVGSDQCTIPTGGDNVEYTYTVKNTGTEEIFNVTVEDDKLDTVPGSPIDSIEASQQVTLMATQFVTENTVNVVTVTGETAAGATCSDTDSAEVIVESLPFECDKPIKGFTMIWYGAQAIRVKAWKGKPDSTLLDEIDNIEPGDEVTVDGFTGKPNDVTWEIFEAGTENKIGESKFHLSCSDPDMNDPEDCGKPQGDGKKNELKYINDWLLEGMVDKTSSFDCTP